MVAPVEEVGRTWMQGAEPEDSEQGEEAVTAHPSLQGSRC